MIRPSSGPTVLIAGSHAAAPVVIATGAMWSLLSATARTRPHPGHHRRDDAVGCAGRLDVSDIDQGQRNAAGATWRLRFHAAERRLGEMLAETIEHGGNHKTKSKSHDVTLTDLGIGKMQSHRWQALDLLTTSTSHPPIRTSTSAPWSCRRPLRAILGRGRKILPAVAQTSAHWPS